MVEASRAELLRIPGLGVRSVDRILKARRWRGIRLEDLARHPEKRKPRLSWGLQHYVRGDLVFEDGTVVMLDELCAQAGALGGAGDFATDPLPDPAACFHSVLCFIHGFLCADVSWPAH